MDPDVLAQRAGVGLPRASPGAGLPRPATATPALEHPVTAAMPRTDREAYSERHMPPWQAPSTKSCIGCASSVAGLALDSGLRRSCTSRAPMIALEVSGSKISSPNARHPRRRPPAPCSSSPSGWPCWGPRSARCALRPHEPPSPASAAAAWPGCSSAPAGGARQSHTPYSTPLAVQTVSRVVLVEVPGVTPSGERTTRQHPGVAPAPPRLLHGLDRGGEHVGGRGQPGQHHVPAVGDQARCRSHRSPATPARAARRRRTRSCRA